MRYFKNPYPDYNNQPVEINENAVKKLISNYLELIVNHIDTCERAGDLYIGNGGISYMFLKIHQFNQLEGFLKHSSLSYAKHFIDLSKKYARSSSPLDVCSFICGNPGIYAVSAIINKELNDIQKMDEDLSGFLKGYEVCEKINWNRDGSDEVLFGRAGYLSGIYWLNQNLPASRKLDKQMVDKLCDVTIESGINFAAKRDQNHLLYHCWGDTYLGAAHGLSAILHMLLESGIQPKDQFSSHKLNLIKSSTDYLLSLQTREGNFACTLDDIGSDKEDKLVHWCHGAPGVIYLMAKAYIVFKEDKYLHSCLKIGELVWQRGLLMKGPGICHGVAGNGYVFLLLFRLTNDQKHLYRAQKFMEFLCDPKFLREARNPDRPYSLYEGIAGTVCFLIDLLQPHKAQFPFMDVFDNKV